MADLIRRFRGLGIAVVVLALSAGVVFAGAPRFTLVNDEETPIEQPTTEQPTTETPTTETPTSETPDEDADDADDADDPEAADAEAPGAHGELVSGAAQASTPPGFRNHGAFVSCVARWHKNPEAAPIVDPTLLTPEECGLEPTAAPEGETGADADEDADAGEDAAGAAGKAKGAAKAKAGKARAEAAKAAAKGRGGR